MRIAVLGTGVVGRTIGGALASLGHEVVIGTRDVAATQARRDPDPMGTPPIGAWLAEHPEIRLAPYRGAGAEAELFVNATNGRASLMALEQVGADQLSGKVVMDLANPLDFTSGYPPGLFVSDRDSLAEQLQRAFPQARVVKTLNTMTAAVMVHPQSVGDGQTTVFLSGNDEDAKATVRSLLQSLGWREIIDLGGISTARGPELYLPLWLRIMGALETPMFNVRVMR
jgi:8-hydroxy-5-deazaflavin:NADPH oxidoreductase